MIALPHYRLFIFALTLGATLMTTACAAPADPVPSPNLLLITLDTLRADHLGLLGYDRPTSPNLDRFASHSTVFSDVTCSMPTTLPSHVTMLTGLTPRQHGVVRNGLVPRIDLDTLLKRCRSRGRRTAAVVSAGVLGARFVANLGLDEHFFDVEPGEWQVPAPVVTNRALRWLTDNGDEPFALWVHYFDPHEPYDPPEDLAATWSRGSSDLPRNLSVQYLKDLNTTGTTGLSPADRQQVIDLYDAEIAFLDHHLSRLLDAVSHPNLAADTVVVIVADHGQAHGEKNFWGHGELLLEPVIKIPLILHLPGQRAGSVVDSAVESLDIFPTLVELLDLGEIDSLPGRSLVPALSGHAITPTSPRHVVRRAYQDSPERRGISILSGDDKLSWYSEPGGERRWHGNTGLESGLDGENSVSPGSHHLASLELAWAEHGVIEPTDPTPLTTEESTMLETLGYLDKDTETNEESKK